MIRSCRIGLVGREGRVFGLIELSFSALATERSIGSSLGTVSIGSSYSWSSSRAQ